MITKTKGNGSNIEKKTSDEINEHICINTRIQML